MLLHTNFTDIYSVAEYAKKPLYRVTCGDIGTKPEEVEEHLKSALNLGMIWDCGKGLPKRHGRYNILISFSRLA